MAPERAPRAQRDPTLDLLRSLALLRVIFWHTFASSWMMAIAAMPIMFFVAGTLLPTGVRWRDHTSVVVKRARRLLVPLWMYGAAVGVTLMLAGQWGKGRHPLASVLTWVVPLTDPTSSPWHQGWLSNHLWYLRAYLWLVLLAPLLSRMAKHVVRSSALMLAVIFAMEWTSRSDWGALRGTPRVLIGDFAAYGFFAVLGLAYARRRPVFAPTTMALGATLLTAASFGYVAVAGLPTGGINASYPAIVLTGMAWLLGLAAVERPLRRLAEKPRIASIARLVSGRALTIYLWHPAAIVLARSLVEGSSVASSVLVVAIVGLLTVVTVLTIGWVEDVAAAHRRKTMQIRTLRPFTAARSSVFVGIAVTSLAIGMPRLVHPAAPGDEAYASGRPPIRPPSFREALTDDAFAAASSVSDSDPTLATSGPPANTPSREVVPPDAVSVGVPSTMANETSPDSTIAATDGSPGAALAAPSTTALPADAPLGARLQAALDEWMATQPDTRSVGVTIMVGDIEWLGEAHRIKDRPAFHAVDRFRIASLTKLFTAALVLRAVDDGLIDLDAPVPPLTGRTLPVGVQQITPRQLLDHSSGLIDYTSAPGYDPDATLDAGQAIDLSLNAPLLARPGAGVHYANTNFLYLGLLLEQVTGRNYPELIDEQAANMGLGATALAVPFRRGWIGYSAGGLVSTLDDLVRWGDALFTPGTVVSEEGVGRLTTLGEHNGGLGTWPICPCWTDPKTQDKKYTAIGHHSGFGGVFHYPRQQATVAVRIEPQSDTAGGLAADLGHRLAELVAQEKARPRTAR